VSWIATLLLGLGLTAAIPSEPEQVTAVRAGTLYTMAGPPIPNGVVLIEGARIRAVGPAASVAIPANARIVEAKVVTPGLIDGRATVGLTGITNTQGHDQDMLDRSGGAIQPELRALDAYNPLEPLVTYVRSFGVTTVHTGHAPGNLVSGQTFVVKTFGRTADAAAILPEAMISVTLGPASTGTGPGTRAKQMSALRSELIGAREAKDPGTNLRLAALQRVIRREVPLLVYAHRAQDIVSALRLAEEFTIRMVLDGAAEAYLVVDELRQAQVPVIVHPTMFRASGDTENLSWENAAILRRAGIPIALQSGYEGYVPKVRVVLFEAALAAAHGLTFEQALGAVTIDAARILGIDRRVGSLEPGKDADLALFDGDPFEYTSRCVGTIVDGKLVERGERAPGRN
jgi:imidazolonepropionase-like amidohydrolase